MNVSASLPTQPTPPSSPSFSADQHTLAPLLQVRHLSTSLRQRTGTYRVLNDVSFALRAGEILGLVGESGSGKSMTAYSILGLLDAPLQVSDGEILFRGQDLRSLSESALRQIRGNRIAMIFQDPMATLNPVLRIDTQMIEAVLAHQTVSKVQAREMALAALRKVGIAAPEQRLLAYPHQFSGGMRQRVAIAIALLNQPDLMICDEPTTALDVTIQGQILYEMRRLCKESGTALIWITHDLSVVAGLADRVAVMYAGQIVESGSVKTILQTPRHPYTQALIAAVPSRHGRGQALQQIPGMAPALSQLPSGCAFQTRCAYASAMCAQTPPLIEETSAEHTSDGQVIHQPYQLRCFHPITTHNRAGTEESVSE